MPRRVQNFLIEVQTVDADLVFLPLAARADLARLQDRLRLRDIPRRLQGDLALRRPVKHPEKVVVRPGHDRRIAPVPTTLEFIKYTIVLVQRT